MADEPNQSVPMQVPPDVFTIPTALVEQWGELPQNERLNFPLTRQEIDHLLVGLLRTLEAQSAFDRTIIEWSTGKLDDANKSLGDFRRLNIDAQNNIRQLAAGIMASALRDRKNG